jgi:predicted membrane protein
MDRIERRERRAARKNNGNIIAGILLLIVGGGLLMRQMNYPLPAWLFTWPMIIIVAGIFIGAINRFRDFGWLLICAVGFFFLADDIWPKFDVGDYIWPAVIIMIGLALLFRPRFKTHYHAEWGWKGTTDDYTEAAKTFKTDKKASKEDILDVAAVFGAVKKNLFSKTFKGGEIVSVFGGVEIDLSQADFEGKVVIESVQIFGGATLIVPPTWQVRSEAVAIFGGIEDKRKHVVSQEPERILVLEGFAMFGGIEIKSY